MTDEDGRELTLHSTYTLYHCMPYLLEYQDFVFNL